MLWITLPCALYTKMGGKTIAINPQAAHTYLYILYKVRHQPGENDPFFSNIIPQTGAGYNKKTSKKTFAGSVYAIRFWKKTGK